MRRNKSGPAQSKGEIICRDPIPLQAGPDWAILAHIISNNGGPH